jgi:hypothetical protein
MAGLGIEAHVGSSGRVFPGGMKASPLLRRWLARLGEAGAVLHTRHRWMGWDADGALVFEATPAACAHSPCVTGGTLNGFCNWCVGTICAQDPYCCNTAWDAQCVSEVATICGQRCDCNVCQQGQSINAYACPCVGSVCAQDPYCCMHGWDAQCVSEVASFCGTPCR